jgi:hypothetical protein
VRIKEESLRLLLLMLGTLNACWNSEYQFQEDRDWKILVSFSEKLMVKLVYHDIFGNFSIAVVTLRMTQTCGPNHLYLPSVDTEKCTAELVGHQNCLTALPYASYSVSYSANASTCSCKNGRTVIL